MDDSAGAIYRTYPARWLMLVIFSLQSFTNAILWISFAPIASPEATTYFGVSTASINVLSIVFMLFYLPGSIMASYCMNLYGLKAVVLIGASLNCLSAIVRYLSVFAVPSIEGYIILLIGQSIGAMGQPFFTNVPARLAGDWFSTSERDIATVIAALSNPLGNAAGQVLPVLFVSMNGAKTTGMPTLLLVELGIAAGSAAWAATCFKNHPPTPPSRSTNQRQLIRQATQDRLVRQASSPASIRNSELGKGDILNQSYDNATSLLDGNLQTHLVDGAPSSPPDPLLDSTLDSMALCKLQNEEAVAEMKKSVAVLLRDKQFRILCLGFGVGLGVFNALLTLIGQLVQPAGYSSDQAGLFGGVLIATGIVGAGMAGGALDATHAYRPVLKGGFVLTWVSVILMLASLRPNNNGMLTASFALMGAFLMPLYPITLETAVECTYPISEEVSGAVMQFVGNVVGLVLTFALAATISLRSNYEGVVTPAAIFIGTVILFCVVVILCFNGEYKRLNHERAAEAEAEAGRRDAGAGDQATHVDHSPRPQDAADTEVVGEDEGETGSDGVRSI